MPLIAYFDASGHQASQKFVVVAGFVSSVETWDAFNNQWNTRLSKDHIGYFHATEFAHSINQFADWRNDEPRRRALLSDLMTILKSHAFRMFGSIVINQALTEQMPSELRDEFYINSYSLAGRAAAGKLRQWLIRERWNTNTLLAFEDGDLGKGLLMQTLTRDGFGEPVFLPKVTDCAAPGGRVVSPLQAADWLAYELFLASKTQEPTRWAIREFLTTPGYDGIGIHSPADIRMLRNQLTTPLDQIVEVSLTPDSWMW